MQTKNKFTPGPWYVSLNGKVKQKGTERIGDYVCQMPWDTPREADQMPESDASARLIAAAPDMLSLLSDMLGDPTSGEKTNIGEYWKEEIKKAIAKARGE
jgi:hypothetical protein